MRRRQFVAVAGAGLMGLGGCLTADPPPQSPTPTRTPPSTTDRASPSLTATATSLQPAIVVMTTPDSIGVTGTNGSQFLYVDVSVAAGDPPDRPSFRLRFDGDTHLQPDDSRLWRAYTDEDTRYDRHAGGGWLLFELPATGDPRDLALTWDGGDTPVRDDVAGSLTDRIAAIPPRLEATVSFQPVVEAGQRSVLSVTVTNEGDVTGHFVGTMNRSGPQIAHAPIGVLSHPIPADSEERWTVTDTFGSLDPGQDAIGDGEADMTYYVHWADGSYSQSVRVVAER